MSSESQLPISRRKILKAFVGAGVMAGGLKLSTAAPSPLREAPAIAGTTQTRIVPAKLWLVRDDGFEVGPVEGELSVTEDDCEDSRWVMDFVKTNMGVVPAGLYTAWKYEIGDGPFGWKLSGSAGVNFYCDGFAEIILVGTESA